METLFMHINHTTCDEKYLFKIFSKMVILDFLMENKF